MVNTDDFETETAKQQELQKLKQFETYQEVRDKGRNTISTRWVLTNKDGNTRARLVAHGFEELCLIPKDRKRSNTNIFDNCRQYEMKNKNN